MKETEQFPKLELPPSLQLYSITEVATILGTSRKLVNSWVIQGELPAFRLGADTRVIRIRRQDLEAFIEKHITGNRAPIQSEETEAN
jgi:excisionase family DNA binding protein